MEKKNRKCCFNITGIQAGVEENTRISVEGNVGLISANITFKFPSQYTFEIREFDSAFLDAIRKSFSAKEGKLHE